MPSKKPATRTEASPHPGARHVKSKDAKAQELAAEAEHQTGQTKENLIRKARQAANGK